MTSSAINYPDDDIRVCQWSNLEIGKWYRIIEMREVELQDPMRMVKILSVVAKGITSEPFNVRTSNLVYSRINRKLAEKRPEDAAKQLFIKNNGTNDSKSHRTYHNCCLTYS